MDNRQWILKQRPEAALALSDLELVTAPVPPVADGQILIRNLFLSLDPTNRLWMSEREQYLEPVKVGQVMRGGTIGVVEESRSPRFSKGDIVLPLEGGWQKYAVAGDRAAWRVHRREDVPLSAYLSVLGPTGYTAYFGVLELCRPNAGETLVVSAAAGAVGSVAGQIAKLKGARVIGIAGSQNKCRWLTDELGFDSAIDYRADDVGASLDRLCPDGIDMNFENVGGPIMDAVFSRLRVNGRMALCGMISTYNDEGPMAGPTDFGRILMKRLTVKGFVVTDYAARFREAQAELAQWIAGGKLKWNDHIVDGLESAVGALDLLFTGGNNGKLLVRID